MNLIFLLNPPLMLTNDKIQFKEKKKKKNLLLWISLPNCCTGPPPCLIFAFKIMLMAFKTESTRKKVTYYFYCGLIKRKGF